MSTLEHTCAHEAGHAAACMLLGVPVRLVDATGDATTLGRTEHEGADGDPETRMKIILGGLVASAESISDLPAWPLDPDHGTTDERRLALLAKVLDLDAGRYGEIVDEVLALSESPEYKRLHIAIAHALEQHGQLDAIALRRIKALGEEKDMQHTTKSATVTAAEQGEFTAIAAAYSVDRVKDQIIPGAFANTIDRWRTSGKRMPLHWNHQGEASNVIGYIDPASMHETDAGLEVSGKLDIDTSDTAREAWRSMKNNAMSLSFGYVSTRQRKRSDWINELHELDLFEISIVPAPANADTRIVSMKSISSGDPDLAAFRTEWVDQLTRAMADPDPAGTLRAKAMRIAREHAPIQIATFDA